MGAKPEVNEEAMLKALSELEDDLLKATKKHKGKGKDDDSDSDDKESASSGSFESISETKKSHVRKDRSPREKMPSSTDEANEHLDPSAGAGPKADMSTGKSFRDSSRESSNIRKGMDASPFLEGLVDNVSDEIDGMRKAIVYVQDMNMAAMSEQGAFNQKLSKAIVAMGNLITEQNEMLKSLGGRPAGVRKSVTNVSEVHERFEKSGAGAGGEFQFDRNTVLRKAVEMVEQGKLPGTVVIGYETTGSMEPQFQKSVYDELLKSSH
jgi:hypothetical protein